MDNKIETLYLLTTNKDKQNEIMTYLNSKLTKPLNIKIFPDLDKIEVPELQGDSQDIIYAKANSAYNIINRMDNISYNNNKSWILIDDTSFSVDSMGGLPGPYIKDFFLKLGNYNLYKLFSSFKQSDLLIAREECYIAIHSLFNKECYIVKGEITGRIVQPDNDVKDEYNWNYFFIPNGSDKTYGRMDVSEKNLISARKEALDKLSYLINNF